MGSAGVPASLTAVAGGDGRAELANVNKQTRCLAGHTHARAACCCPLHLN